MRDWRALLLGVFLLGACQAPAASPPSGGAVPAAPPPAAQAPTSSAGTAPTSGAAAPASLETVRVGTVNSASDAVFYWEQEHGYLREQGLDLEATPFNGAQLMIAPLGADQLDVGGGGPGPGLFNAILRGVNVRIVADRSRAAPGTRFNCLSVRKPLLDSGQVRSFADLRGRVFAENVPGVLTTSLVEREMQKAGYSLQDVTSVTMGFPDMVTGMANDAVDFGVLTEPYITLSEQRGVAQCWKPTSEMGPNFQIAVILYGPTFAEQRADVARRFMLAHLRALRDYHRAFFGDGENRPEFVRLMGRVSGVTDLDLLERMEPTWADPNGSVNVDSLADVQRWYIGRGEQTGEVDFSRVVDMSFVDYAVERLGRAPGT
ncbi:MAG TPA: ABC transporter substrate-binding protein [Chloroflexota bacterium]|nr:ABC transporter substrate-binding protein [Chloroflexota bacterium]